MIKEIIVFKCDKCQKTVKGVTRVYSEDMVCHRDLCNDCFDEWLWVMKQVKGGDYNGKNLSNRA
jgi:hypothetical protein